MRRHREEPIGGHDRLGAFGDHRKEDARVVSQTTDRVGIGVDRHRDDLDAQDGQGPLASRQLIHAWA